MKHKIIVAALALALPIAGFSQSREAFLKQQAYAEMQRVTGQIDVLQNNVNELQGRVGNLERGANTSSLRHEIDALKAAIAELRREMQSQRGEIVRDISGRLAKIQQPAPPPKPTTVTKVVYNGPHREYVVKSGDTLSLIAEAFNCPLKKIREMNSLKNDNLRVGQKLMLPKE